MGPLKLALSLLLGCAAGAEPLLAVEGRLGIMGERTVRVHLQGTQYTGMSRQDGRFTIHNVAPGVYTLEVDDAVSMWPQPEVDVGMRQPGLVQVFSTRKEALPYPFELAPLGKMDYFEKREGFNVRGMLMNPMVLTMVFSLFSIFIMPILAKNMDPEALKEIENAQSMLAGSRKKPESVEDKTSKKGSSPGSS